MRFWRSFLKDNTDKNSGVLFKSAIDGITEGAFYNLIKMRVQNCQDESVLKSTENTEASENTMLGLVKTAEDEDVSFHEIAIAVKVVSIDLKTLC